MNLRFATSFPSCPAKLAVWLVVGFVLAGNSTSNGDTIVTPLRFQIERSRPAKIDIPMRRGEYIDLQLQYFDYNEAVHFSGVQSLDFVLTAGAITNHFPARIMDATNGIVAFTITPTNLWASNNYLWELPVRGSNSAMIRAYGTISVTPSIGYQNLTNTPPPMSTFDFATALLYNAGLAPWPLYSWFTSGQANLEINDLTVHGTVSGVDGGGGIGRDGAPGISPTITLTNTLTGDAACTNLGSSSNVVLQFTVPQGPKGEPGTNVVVFVGAEKGDKGDPGADGQPVTNITYTFTTNINLITSTTTNIIMNNSTNIAIAMTISTNFNVLTVTNLSLVTSNWISTNINLNITNNITGLTNMPAAWDADQIGTNRLSINVGGQQMVRVDTQGITMVHGSLQMYEEDLNCNVRLYDGTRLAPSLTFLGHPNDWGFYDRGYGGYSVGAWSVGGVEVGVMHANGLTLMSTNFAFNGTHVGNLSGCWGYSEPIFNTWKTNMQFSILTLSNMTITPGSLTTLDRTGTTRGSWNYNGLGIRDAGGIERVALASDIRTKNQTGLTLTMTDTGYKTYDPASGMMIFSMGAGYSGDTTFYCQDVAGYLLYVIQPMQGLQLYDPSLRFLRTRISYNYLNMLGNTSSTVFRVDASSAGMETITLQADSTVTNKTLYFTAANGVLASISAVSGRGVFSSLALTNSGTVSFYGASGVLFTTLTMSNGMIQAWGRNIYSTNWPSGNSTNLGIGGRTNIYQLQNGTITNIIIL